MYELDFYKVSYSSIIITRIAVGSVSDGVFNGMSSLPLDLSRDTTSLTNPGSPKPWFPPHLGRSTVLLHPLVSAQCDTGLVSDLLP